MTLPHYLTMYARRETASWWAANNPVLGADEPGQESDGLRRIKFGDGSTPWLGLPYSTGGGSSDSGLVDIPISTVEGDWDNTAGAWVFNGDGTVTSTAVADVMSLPLPDEAQTAGIWSYLKLAALLESGATVRAFVGGGDATLIDVDVVDGDGTYFAWLGSSEIGNDNTSWGPSALAGSPMTAEMVLIGAAMLGRVNDLPVVSGLFTASNYTTFSSPSLLLGLTLTSDGIPGTIVDLAACELKVAALP